MSAKHYNAQLQNIETPFYFYDLDLLNWTLATAQNEASKYGYKLHYALKANFENRILETISKAGFGADCVSGNEVKQAIACGFPASEVVFAGVGKSDKEIRYALSQDIFAFNVESLPELEVLNELAAEAGKIARFAFRINPDVDPRTHQHISTGKADNKFGISYTEIDEAISSLNRMQNVEFIGIHFHIGSQIRDMKVFENLCIRANEIRQWFTEQGLKPAHINLGGGLGVNYEAPDDEPMPDFAAYFGIINRTLQKDADQTVHFELGRSLVAQCGELITRVLFHKTTASGLDLLIVDAGMTDLMRPALYQAYHKIENLSNETPVKTYTVGGPICESTDIFARNVPIAEAKRGDLLTLRTAGAYGAAMVSQYNLRDIPEAVYSEDL